LLRSVVCCVAVSVLALGCSSSTAPPPAPVDPVEHSLPAATAAPSDDAEAVAAIEAVTDKLRRDQDQVIEVDFRGSEVKDADLSALTKLPSLKSVLLAETQVTDEGLKSLGQVTTLESLDLRECKVTDAGLAHLVPLAKLKVLKLSGKNGDCQVSDDGMEHVAKLTNLKVLGIDFLWISEAGLTKLGGLSELSELYMAGVTIGNESIALIAQSFPKLRKLRIAQTHIDSAGMADLPKLTNLEELDISECAQILDGGTESLSQMSKLQKLNLWRLNLSDEGIRPVAGLTKLQWLNLDNTRLSDQGTPYLSGLKNLTFLHLGSTQISDAGLGALEGLTKLKDLKVTRTNVTQAGADELQKKLPETTIQLIYIEGQ
jgi:Leucine rich repeat/Leucine Rich repeat